MFVLAYKCHLVCVKECKAAVEVHSFRHLARSGFCDEFASRSKLEVELTSKLSWNIVAVKQCVDETTGLETIFVLSSSKTIDGTENRFCILKANWREGLVLDLSHASKSTSKNSVFNLQLAPVFEFTLDTTGFKAVCALAHGPRVVFVEQNTLLLFCENPQQSDVLEKHEYEVCDTEQTDDAQAKIPIPSVEDIASNSQTDTKMLCIVSEQSWILSLILISARSWSALTVVALEKHPLSSEFEKVTLRAHNFLPPQYASKVSAVTVEPCKRTLLLDQSYAYENICTVGLNDGYVMVFKNGIMQTCVCLEIPSNIAICPVTAMPLKVKQVILFKDILICHTVIKDCFAVCRATNKVVHQWSNVQEPLIGDFLHNGGKQLLLLFDGWLPRQPQSGYLMTDLQGFVEDRRETTLNSSLEEERQAGNLQRVICALQEQGQTLARQVAEEEQKLAAKQMFLSETWRRLQDVSCHGLNTVRNIPAPEVPLVPLLGEGKISATCRTTGPTLETAQDVSVLSVWHRFMDTTCVVGVRIMNNSTRNLTKCTAMLTVPSAPNTQQQLSVHTRLWQCLRSDTSAHAAVDRQVLTRQTENVHPSESVTVTCSFDVPELGLHGELQCLVYLQFLLREQGDFTTSHSDLLAAGIGMASRPGKDSPGNAACREMPLVKHISCGSVTVTPSEMLMWRGELESLAGGDFGNSSDVFSDDKLEEHLLLLNSVQHPWTCSASFALHEATQLTKCLPGAGFVLHRQLGQYIALSSAPVPLHFTRLQVQRILPLPARAVNFVVFARDSNQLLLFLRHLYSHLPPDTSITLVTDSGESPIQRLVKVMATELREKNRLGGVVKETYSATVDVKKCSTGGQQQDLVGIQLQQTVNQNKEVLSLEDVKLERESFEKQQKLYRQSLGSSMCRGELVRLEAAAQICEIETDVTVAKLKF